MDNLPDHLIINLSRLNDSTELARCKCVSKTLNTLACQVRSIHLYCSVDRFNKMHSPAEARSKVNPFKTIFNKLISDAQVPIESVSLGLEDDFLRYSEIPGSDLFLTSGRFSNRWMRKIGHGLISMSISSLSFQSRERRTNILDIISYHCHSLVELKLEHTHLLVNDMHMMPLLTRLTLNYVAMCDESLNKLIESLPCLQVLYLISCFSGENDSPKIHHLNLTDLKWTISESDEASFFPSSHTVFAPNLTRLELETDYPSTLSIHAPLLSYFNLTLKNMEKFNVDRFKSLKTLCLASAEIYNTLLTFPSSTTVENLTLLLPSRDLLDLQIKFSLHNVLTVFPKVTSLTLGSDVWSQKILYSLAAEAKDSTSINNMKGLKQITLYLLPHEIDRALYFILYVVGICMNLSDLVLFIHREVDLGVAIGFVSSCMSQCPRVRFRWGTWDWEEGTEKNCISSSIVSAANNV